MSTTKTMVNPLLAVLLNFRHNCETWKGIQSLVQQLVNDRQARVMLVIPTDADDELCTSRR